MSKTSKAYKALSAKVLARNYVAEAVNAAEIIAKTLRNTLNQDIHLLRFYSSDVYSICSEADPDFEHFELDLDFLTALNAELADLGYSVVIETNDEENEPIEINDDEYYDEIGFLVLKDDVVVELTDL